MAFIAVLSVRLPFLVWVIKYLWKWITLLISCLHHILLIVSLLLVVVDIHLNQFLGLFPTVDSVILGSRGDHLIAVSVIIDQLCHFDRLCVTLSIQTWRNRILEGEILLPDLSSKASTVFFIISILVLGANTVFNWMQDLRICQFFLRFDTVPLLLNRHCWRAFLLFWFRNLWLFYAWVLFLNRDLLDLRFIL